MLGMDVRRVVNLVIGRGRFCGSSRCPLGGGIPDSRIVRPGRNLTARRKAEKRETVGITGLTAMRVVSDRRAARD
jgi:hypothetical protein